VRFCNGRKVTLRALRSPLTLLVLLTMAMGLCVQVGNVGPASAQLQSNSSGAGATCSNGAGSGSPGVTSTSISVASLGTLSGSLAADFAAMVPGVRAYFEALNAAGGINGRKVNLTYTLDDTGNPSEFSALAHDLTDQDHAFAAVGVSSPFFSPNYLVENCVPTYGYNVTGNWQGPPNLFAPDGSTLFLPQVATDLAYLMKKYKLHSFATIAYGVAASSNACSTVNQYMTMGGYKQAYSDLSVQVGGNVAPDVQRMKSAGAQMIMSCMDVNGNINLARSVQQYGLKVKQLWENGSDQDVINQYANLLQGVIFEIGHVPFTASTSFYPGLKQYLQTMNKYAPKYTYDELAAQGYSAAALFAQGVKMAGSNVTQSNVIKQDNLITAFNANGFYAVTNWTVAHTSAPGPFCGAYIQVQGKKLVPIFGSGKQVFHCFAVKANTPPNPTPVPLTPGTPGT
jgi:ABC-type branched-subunit amino acid transport system substrate-binding protein